MNINPLNIFEFSFERLRQQLRRLDSLPLLGAMVAGISAALHLGLEAWHWGVIAIAAAVVMLLAKRVQLPLRMVMFAALTATIFTLQRAEEVPLATTMDMHVTISGESRLRQNYRMAEAEVVIADMPPFKVEVRTPQSLTLRRGDSFDITTRIAPLSKQPTRYSLNRQRLGYVGSIWASAEQITNFAPLGRELFQHRVIDSFHSIEKPSPQGEAVALAIGIGYRGDIAAESGSIYQKSGLSHLLAISGLHVGMVLTLLLAIFRPLTLLWRGLEMRDIAVVASMWLYVWACGMMPSAVRAAMLFTLLVLLRYRIDGNASPLNRLGKALIVILILRPSLIFDVGLQLSAVAVAAIMLYALPLMRALATRHATIDYTVGLVVVGIVATIAIQPLAALHFGNISFVSILVNPVAVMLGYAILVAVLLSTMLPMPLQEVVAEFAVRCGDLLNTVAEGVTKWGIGYTQCETDGTTIATIYGVTLVITLFLGGFRRRQAWNIKDI